MRLLLKKILYISFLALYLSLFTFDVNSQPITWQRLYNGPSNIDDEAWDICQATDGNYIVSCNTGFSARAAYILKLNVYGDTIWAKRFYYGNPHTIAATTDGGCVFTGGGGLFKLNSSGDSVWSKTYTTNAQVWDVKRTSDNGFVACGRIDDDKGYIFKTDANGNLQWQKTYTASYVIRYYTIDEGIGGGYIAAGYSYNNLLDTTKAVVTKVDNNGNLVWEKRYKILNNGADAYSINKFNNIYIMAGGASYLSSAKAYVAKLDINGNMFYSQIINSGTDDYLNDMKIISPNRFVFSVEILGNNGSLFLYTRAVITDSLGNILYQREFPSPDWTYLKRIEVTNTKHILLAGTADFIEGTAGFDDIYIVKMDSTLTPPPFIGIVKINGEVPQKYSLSQNYPNPFNPKTAIRFNIPEFSSNVEIKVYDILGNYVTSLIKQDLTTGTYETEFDGAKFASGIYIYILHFDNNIIETKKMVLIK